MRIKVLTDTTSDLPQADVERYQIGLIPLEVNFGHETYLDRFELSIEDFFDKLARSKVNPTTSQPSTGRFIEAFEEALKDYDLVVYISVSDKLSGTFGGAKLAAEYIKDDRLLLFDSENVSFSEGMLVLGFCRRLDKIKSKEEALRYLSILRSELKSYYIVDTLDYLIRGGRVSRMQGTLGNLLGIKPILTVQNGKLEVIGKARGMKKAMAEVLKRMEADVPDKILGSVGLFHAMAKDQLHEFSSSLGKQFVIRETHHALVGSVIGTHSGPGAIAVAFFKDCNL